MQQTSLRAGVYIQQPTGYRAFQPKALPPDPPLDMDNEMWTLLSEADRALGRLDGATSNLPNPDLFVMMYVRKEAVLSSQIEGTQASLNDVLEQEARVLRESSPDDVGEVLNYVNSMNYGLARLAEFPLSLRLLKEIHERLMAGTRGHEKNPGEFRRSQNWIGSGGGNLQSAKFVPPAPDDMHVALGEWERFLYEPVEVPVLIRAGLLHAQFETIHPFLDGNGRVGRLLITFFLCEREVLVRPMLYLSHYFKANRTEYYDRLQAIRDHGDWENWLKFFLRGIAVVANEATDVARKILNLRESDRERIRVTMGRATADAIRLHENLFARPFINVSHAMVITGRGFAAANRMVGQLQELGILEEQTGNQRNRVFLYREFLRLFDDSELRAREVKLEN